MVASANNATPPIERQSVFNFQLLDWMRASSGAFAPVLTCTSRVEKRRLSSPVGLYHPSAISLIMSRSQEGAYQGNGVGRHECTGRAID